MNKQQESTVLHVLLATMLGICLVLGQGLYSAVAIAEEMSDDLGPDSIELIDEVPECEVVAQEEAEDEDSAIICMESNDTPIVVNESDNNAQSGEDIEQQGLMYGHDDVDGVEIQSSDASSAHDNLYARGISTSAMVATTSGYTRIYYQDGKVCIEDYDNGFKFINKRTLQGELDYFGGFFNGADAYYLVFGRSNTAEDNNVEVVRVVKYNKSWTRLGSCALRGDSAFGHQVRYPFDAGTLDMVELNGVLYIATGHEGYVDPEYNQGHQGLIVFAVNESTLQGSIVDADLWHSFSQHLAIRDKDNIFLLEESEGSRQAQITKYTADELASGDTWSLGTTIPILEYGGSRTSAWAIATYATADDIEVSANNILTVGTSIDQARYDDSSYTKAYNVYLTVTPINDFSSEATTLKWLTADNLPYGYRGVKLTKINDNRFMVSWERYTDENEKSLATTELDTLSTHVLHYLFIDGNGNVIGKEHTAPAAISGCHPIVKGNKVVYYASNAGAVSFYCIDSDPSKAIFSKKTTLVAGKDATWSFKNGVLTVAGTGALDGSLSSDGLSVIKDKITKIIIKKGITAIPDETFSYLRAVKEVRIPTGVTSIGSHAFYGLEAPDATVCIPASVKTIAEDAFDSGWYTWGYENKIIYATIYCPKGSYAQTYAKQQGITCYEPSVTVKKTTVSYTGKKAATPKTTCKGTIGKLSYIYYCDKACTKKTSKTQGAASSGAMPVKAGTYYVRATAAADDTFGKVRSKAAQYIIIKAKQTIKLAKSKFTASRGAVSKLKLKATASAKKKITFAKKSGNSRITVSSAGVVKVPKGMKKGTYAIKVKITAAGNANYKKTAVTKKVTIVVK